VLLNLVFYLLKLTWKLKLNSMTQKISSMLFDNLDTLKLFLFYEIVRAEALMVVALDFSTIYPQLFLGYCWNVLLAISTHILPFDLALRQHLLLKHNRRIAYIWRVDIPNIPWNIVTGPFKYAEQNGYLKILIESVWKLMGSKRQMLVLQLVLIF
jgi:hypothetical protein